jgi:hypothetical protein
VKFNSTDELNGAALRKLAINRDDIVYVLTDRGAARLFDQTLRSTKAFVHWRAGDHSISV